MVDEERTRPVVVLRSLRAVTMLLGLADIKDI